MNRNIFFASLIFPILCYSMQDNINHVSSIHDVPSYCVTMIELLHQEPDYTGKNLLTKKEKVLPLDSHHDAKLCHLINQEVTNINPTLGLMIYAIIPENNLANKFDQPIEQGLRLFCDKEKTFCTISLTAYFKQILHRVQTGWKKTDPISFDEQQAQRTRTKSLGIFY